MLCHSLILFYLALINIGNNNNVFVLQVRVMVWYYVFIRHENKTLCDQGE